MSRILKTSSLRTYALRDAARTLQRNASASYSAWSTELSFASPESDFSQRPINPVIKTTESGPIWSKDISFCSPENDFSSVQARHVTAATRTVSEKKCAIHEVAWSRSLSFSSPETDFMTEKIPNAIEQSEHDTAGVKWSGQLSFASPEADFILNEKSTAALEGASQPISAVEWSQQLSFASPETDFASEASSAPQTEIPLPKTFKEALMEHQAAIVVTTATAPYTIVHVNRAWEDLCGFEKNEVAHSQTLACIQGDDTNVELASSGVRKVTQDEQEQFDMFLVNYRKSGERFINHFNVGKVILNEETTDVQLLVGVLTEVQPNEVPLRMVA